MRHTLYITLLYMMTLHVAWQFAPEDIMPKYKSDKIADMLALLTST